MNIRKRFSVGEKVKRSKEFFRDIVSDNTDMRKEIGVITKVQRNTFTNSKYIEHDRVFVRWVSEEGRFYGQTLMYPEDHLQLLRVRKTVSVTFTDDADTVIINGKEYVAVNQTCGCCAHYTPEGIKRLTTGGKKLVGR